MKAVWPRCWGGATRRRERPRCRPTGRGGGGGRGALESWRRSAGAAEVRTDAGGRHRAHGPRRGGGPQGLSVDDPGNARSGRARQPSPGRARRHPAHGTRAGRSPNAWSGKLVRGVLRTRCLAPPSLHASLIQGGQELSSYPARAWLEFERPHPARRVQLGGPRRGWTSSSTRYGPLTRSSSAIAARSFRGTPMKSIPVSPLPGLLTDAARHAGLRRQTKPG
jgi:hypothetical protein